jgi:hypothetical protein
MITPHGIKEEELSENSIDLVEDEDTNTKKVKLFLCLTN